METMEYGVRYQQWLNDSQMEPELLQELEAIKNDDKEIYERFYQDLTLAQVDCAALWAQVLIV